VSGQGLRSLSIFMLSYLDPLLFPDQCEIFEVSQGRYVYSIFKNGSRLLEDFGGRKLDYSEIKEIQKVEVFVRDPYERYVSGVQSYLRLNPELDRETVLKVISECLFLNRHFSLQFHWLLNLTRFTNASLHIRPINELDTIAGKVWNNLERDHSLIDYFKQNQKLSYYLQLDKVLTEDFMDKTVNFKKIVEHIKQNQNSLYTEVIQRSINLCDVLG